MRGRGYVKELEPGRFLVRISITDPLTGKRGQPSKTVRGTRKDAELALARLQIDHLGGTAVSTDTTLDVLVDQFLSAPTGPEHPWPVFVADGVGQGHGGRGGASVPPATWILSLWGHTTVGHIESLESSRKTKE